MTHPDITHMERTGETPSQTRDRVSGSEPASYCVRVECCVDVWVPEAESEEQAEREAINTLKAAVKGGCCDYVDGEVVETVAN